MMKRKIYPQSEREIFRLSDGGEVAIDLSPTIDNDKPLVVIIPGILSTIEDHYIQTQIQFAKNNGYEWCLINYRGSSHKLSDGKPFDSNDLISFKEPLLHIINQHQER